MFIILGSEWFLILMYEWAKNNNKKIIKSTNSNLNTSTLNITIPSSKFFYLNMNN